MTMTAFNFGADVRRAFPRLAGTLLTLTASFLVTQPAYADLDGGAIPAANFDLSHWKLTIPVNAVGSTAGVAAEISGGALIGPPGYSSQWFHSRSDGGMVFWAPVNGATTDGSSYPRSELRELIDPNNGGVNWTSAGNSVLDVSCKVNVVPTSTGKVVVGQIHGYNLPPLVKLRYQYSTSSKTGRIDALINVNASSTITASYPLATGIALNQGFYYRIAVSKGVLSMSVNGATATVLKIDPSWQNAGFYFKAGTYVQANGTSATDGGMVTLYRLAATHPDNALALTTGSVTAAVAGQAYRQPLTAAGGIGTLVWKLISGQLPTGLALNPTDGTISGTPAASTADGNTHAFTVQAADPLNDSAARTYKMAIAAAP
jgi:hypothetical protein